MLNSLDDKIRKLNRYHRYPLGKERNSNQIEGIGLVRRLFIKRPSN